MSQKQTCHVEQAPWWATMLPGWDTHGQHVGLWLGGTSASQGEPVTDTFWSSLQKQLALCPGCPHLQVPFLCLTR